MRLQATVPARRHFNRIARYEGILLHQSPCCRSRAWARRLNRGVRCSEKPEQLKKQEPNKEIFRFGNIFLAIKGIVLNTSLSIKAMINC